MATYIKGKSETIAIWDGTSAYEPLVCLTSGGLSESVEEITAPITKCDSTSSLTREAGTYSYEIPFEGLYAETEAGKLSWAEIRTKLRALGEITWRITTTYATGTDVEYGTGFFSALEKTGEVEEFISFSGTRDANRPSLWSCLAHSQPRQITNGMSSVSRIYRHIGSTGCETPAGLPDAI